MSQTVTLVRLGGSPTFASLNVNGPTNLSGSFNTSGSLNVSGSVFVSGSLVVSGSIIAQSLVVNTTSYNSGSNIFGSSPSNTQVFTGSMYVGGLISGSVFYGSGANLTQIPNAALTNSTISGISLGSNLGTLTFGTYLTGTSYNGSTGVTIATNATNANTVSTIVARDASGNFSAGTITAALSGNASTATQTNVTLTGTNVADVMYAAIADNDFARIRVGGTATNAGYLELATADDGTEPIYVRQYTGTFTSLTRTATLLDGSGNTSFPGTVSATFSGNLSGNATTAGGYAVETGRNNNASKIVTTDANGYIQCGYINSSNGNENNNSNADRVWGTNGSDNYLRTYRTSALSVSYAASAGSATSATTATSATSAGSATYATYLNSGQSSTDVSNISSRVNSGFFQDSSTESHTGWPSGASSWYHLISSTHSNPANYYALQFAAPFFAQGVYTRNTNNSGTQAWYLMLTTGNYTSYVVPSSGGTFGGNVTINGSSNTPLSMNATEPYMEIVANGGSNTAGIAIKPTTGYDAAIGNFRGGNLNLMANSTQYAQISPSGLSVTGVISSTGQITTGGSIAFSGGGSQYLYLNDAAKYMLYYDTSTASYAIGNNGAQPGYTLYLIYGLYTTSLYNSSDATKKKNIVSLTNCLDKVKALRPVSFEYIDKGDGSFHQRTELGFIAQEVEPILPDLVDYSEKNGYAMNYLGMTAVLTEAIKELNAKLDAANIEIEALKAK